MAREPGKIWKENPVGCTGEDKRLKGNIREGSREVKTVTVLELSTLSWYLISMKFCTQLPLINTLQCILDIVEVGNKWKQKMETYFCEWKQKYLYSKA